MRETWYMLENGDIADPADVETDDAGALRHKSGVPVAMKGDVPHSIGVDPDEERAKAVAPAKDPVKARVTKPAPSKRFKTR